MYKYYSIFYLLIVVGWPGSKLRAQSANQLIDDLQTIYKYTRSLPCTGQQLVSNRAMNLFLSDKIGSYLTDFKSLSFYKNYITLDASTGVFSITHNLFQAKGIDEPVRSFLMVGLKANVANALASSITNKTFTNELGATIQKTWIAKPRTKISDCFEKNLMNAKLESILKLLVQKIKKQEEEFAKSLALMDRDTLSDSDLTKIKEGLKSRFYMKLREKYSREFATLQYQELIEAGGYKVISTHWTNLHVYLPFITEQFVVTRSLNQFSENRKAYPFELSLSHTRFWETKASGRIFLILEAGIHLNNSVESLSLEGIEYSQYKNSGGADTLLLGQRKINTIYVGSFQTFVSPAARVKFIYYPPKSHVGLSSTLEQNVGIYKALNWTLGFPVVLINKSGAPSSNLEFQIRYFDISHTVFSNKAFKDNISINLTAAVPLSKIIY